MFVEYAKAGPEDVLMLVTAHNRGPDPAPLHVLPQLWFRNLWSWRANANRPDLYADNGATIGVKSKLFGGYALCADGEPTLLFCDNDTNVRRLFGMNGVTGHFKDAFHEYLVAGRQDAVNPAHHGTKAGVHYRVEVPGRGSARFRLRLARGMPAHPFADFDGVLEQRRAEADEFYADLQAELDDPDARRIQRQAFAGMIWNKQFFHYDVMRWLDGDPTQPPPPESHRHGRNSEWRHLNNYDIISMPDKWEYPWYAAWDLAFHCIPLALIDAEFAKQQLVMLTREWYMHPNGQLPAYEWAFSRRQPAGARLGGLAGVPARPQAARRSGRPRLPRARVPQADAELHLVGEPQGRPGPQRVPGRLPRSRQHRRVRPHRRPCPPAGSSTRPTAPPGWRCTA